MQLHFSRYYLFISPKTTMNSFKIQDHLSVEDFSKICRFCLTQRHPSNPHHPLFVEQQGQYSRFTRTNYQSLLEIINSCLSIRVSKSATRVCAHIVAVNRAVLFIYSKQIEPDDGLPLSICSACERLITKLNSFRQQCISSAVKLNAMKILSSYKKAHTADTQPTANTQCSSSSLADDRNDDEDIDVMLDQNNFEQVDIDFDSDAVNSLAASDEPRPFDRRPAVRTERASPTRKRRPAASSSDPDDNRTPAIIAEKRSKREQLSEDEDDDSENGIYRRQYG